MNFIQTYLKERENLRGLLNDILQNNRTKAAKASKLYAMSHTDNEKAKHDPYLECKYLYKDPIGKYHGAKNSDRLYPKGFTLTNIAGILRTAVLDGEHYMDIQQAYLSFASMAWDVKELREYIESGNTIWSDITWSSPMHKPAYKIALYSIMFGSTNYEKELIKNLKAIGSESPKKDAERFLGLTVIKALIHARNARINAIRKGELEIKNWRTGQVIECDIRKPFSAISDKSIRSALAQEIQSIERWIMECIFSGALARKDFTILSYEFDGLSYHVEEDADHEEIKEWFRKTVQDAAEIIADNLVVKLTFNKHEFAI